MDKCKVEKFSLTTIENLLSKSDLDAVRLNLSSLIGSAVLKVSGKDRKCAKRDGVCRLVIEPDGGCRLVVLADCLSDAEKVKARKIKKGSAVTIRGKFQSAGSLMVCLSDCRLI
jgi:hypothetical protein